MILDKIVAKTRHTLAECKKQMPMDNIIQSIKDQSAPRDFAGALQGQHISLIAEIKRASPSKGELCPNLVASSLARTYQNSGASAISVLTEPDFFKGSLTDLETVRAEVNMPLLRKDFIFDEYQVYEARARGADAILLIVAILTQHELKNLLDTTHSLGMKALVETHSHEELLQALELSPRIIGINNRNLNDFSVDIETTLKLRHMIPSDTIVVSESGIHTHNEVLRLQQAGVNAILVGEALVTSPDPGVKIKELLGQ